MGVGPLAAASPGHFMSRSEVYESSPEWQNLSRPAEPPSWPVDGRGSRCQNMQLWHRIVLNLKSVNNKPAQEELFALPHLPKSRTEISLGEASPPPLPHTTRTCLLTRGRKAAHFTKLTFISHLFPPHTYFPMIYNHSVLTATRRWEPFAFL